MMEMRGLVGKPENYFVRAWRHFLPPRPILGRAPPALTPEVIENENEYVSPILVEVLNVL